MNRWKFSHSDVITILRHYQELRSGLKLESPPGNDNPEAQWTGRNQHSSFENSCLLAAEIYSRVKRCSFDGYLVIERYGLDSGNPVGERKISGSRGISLNQVYQSIERVIKYCTGRNRKKIPYEKWIQNITE